MGNQRAETKPGLIKLIWFFDAPLTVGGVRSRQTQFPKLRSFGLRLALVQMWLQGPTPAYPRLLTQDLENHHSRAFERTGWVVSCQASADLGRLTMAV